MQGSIIEIHCVLIVYVNRYFCLAFHVLIPSIRTHNVFFVPLVQELDKHYKFITKN